MLSLNDPSVILLFILAAMMGFFILSDIEIKVEDEYSEEETGQENSAEIHRLPSANAANEKSGAATTSAA